MKRWLFILLFFSQTLEAQVKTEVATLAGGCFWGMEEIILGIKGVINTEVGYTGGTVDEANYLQVKTGKTGHAEAVKIEFDPQVLKYETLLEWFFRIHDPTTKDRQGNDIGTQYRSAIFYHSPEQLQTARQVLERVEKSGVWKKPVVTEIVPAHKWWKAEDYHQKYLKKNPGGYTCHYVRKLDF